MKKLPLATKIASFIFFLFTCNWALAQGDAIGMFDHHEDIGHPKTVGAHTMKNMPDDALVGLFICSHDPEVIGEARVWDVHIDVP